MFAPYFVFFQNSCSKVYPIYLLPTIHWPITMDPQACLFWLPYWYVVGCSDIVGGFRPQGRSAEGAMTVVREALALQVIAFDPLDIHFFLVYRQITFAAQYH